MVKKKPHWLNKHIELIPWIIAGILITAAAHGVIYWLYNTGETHIFLHIPKTGGTAVNQWIDQQHQYHHCQSIRTAHTHYLDAENAIQLGYKPFTIIRHPTDRFISSFYYWKHGSKDITAWRRADHWRKAEGIETPNELIDILKNPKHPQHKKTIDALFNRNQYTHRHHFLPQSKWLKTYKDQTIIICYHAQNLNKNLQEAFIKHDIHCPIEKLPIINQSITPLRQRKNHLSLENVQWLKATYDDDFKLWQQYCGD